MFRPKHNPEAELGIIGTLVFEGSHGSIHVQKAILQLEAAFFYKPTHQELFNLIKKCFDNKQPFDLVSLLGMKLADDVFDLMSLISDNFFSTSRLFDEIDELKRNYELRQQMELLKKTYVACENEPLSSLAQDLLFDGLQKIGNVRVKKLEDGATYDDIKRAYDAGEFKNNEIVETGLDEFADCRNGSLITIAGASGIGKTFFGIYLMDCIARYQPNKQCLFFSLEMARNEIWERHLAILDGRKVNGDKFRIYDQPRIDIEYIETVCRLQALQCPLSVIVIDYLALVTSKTKHDRHDLAMADISQRLAALSLELNCVVICLSQVNRDASKRDKSDRCPYPMDVADSIGSVRSSSWWLGIDRPETYSDDHLDKNLFVVKCRKNRRGENFDAYFDFNNGCFKPRKKPFWNVPDGKTTKQRFDERLALDRQIGDL
jgi:replicative DNA helicase